MESLHTQFQQYYQRVVVIVGMGGLGKSELAIQYANRYQDVYPGGICWLNTRAGDLLTQLIQYCQLRLGMMLTEELVQQPLSIADSVTWYVSNWWIEGNVLVVLDDVFNLLDCKPLLDLLSPRFRILITTRQQGLDASFCEFPLNVLHLEDALELLATLAGSRIEKEYVAATALCEALGCLPLGLELVGRYFSTNPFLSVAEVSQSLALQDQYLMSQTTYMMANQRGVLAAFNLSWQQLNEVAQQLAQILSFFAPGEIPWELVNQVVAETDLEETSLTLAKTLLYQQSLLQKVNKVTLQLHPLIREFFTAQRQNHPNQDIWQQSYIQGIAGFAKEIPYVLLLEDIARLAPAVPHIVALVKQSLTQIPNKLLEPLFRGIVYFYNGQALYTEAQTWAEQGLAVLRERFGEEYLGLTTILTTLANLYQDQGFYSEAKPLLLQSLEITKRHLGADHALVAKNLNNLANLYKDQGLYSEAKPLLLQSLEITKRLPGDNDLEMIPKLNTLGDLYQDQGRYSEAEPLFLQSLEVTKRRLGDDHPITARVLNSLACLYKAQDRYSEVEPLFLQSLEVTKRRLGDDHPMTAVVLSNLANLYKDQGRYSEAEPLFLQSLEVTKRRLGDDHREIIPKLNNLANLYKAQDRYSEAEPLFLQAIHIAKCRLGNDHPSMNILLGNLARLYKNQDRYNESESFLRQSLDITKRHSGENSPKVAELLKELVSLKQTKRRKKAFTFVRLALVGLIIGLVLHTLIIFIATQNPQVLFRLMIALALGLILWAWNSN
nr:tetratricopeptide repeat protein [Trichocoleus sp. FACHB-591]